MDMFTAQQIGNIHLAQTADIYLTSDQFVNARHGTGYNTLDTTDIIHHAHQLSRRRGDGNDHFIDMMQVNRGRQIVDCTNYSYAMNRMFLFGRVIIEKTNRS